MSHFVTLEFVGPDGGDKADVDPDKVCAVREHDNHNATIHLSGGSELKVYHEEENAREKVIEKLHQDGHGHGH